MNKEQSKSPLQIWAENEVKIACDRERELARKDDDLQGCCYGISCYESALKAFNSLCNDDHSGCSIRLTHKILNDLIDGKPLTPIEDTPEVWHNMDKYSIPGCVSYQCKRCSALFKYVYENGKIEYHYNNLEYCVDINNPTASYHYSLATKIIEEMFPITMPFVPPIKPFKVVCEDFLTDKKNGDYDTVGILYTIKPDGERVDINRYFKECTEKYMVEIDEKEYNERKAMKIEK